MRKEEKAQMGVGLRTTHEGPYTEERDQMGFGLAWIESPEVLRSLRKARAAPGARAALKAQAMAKEKNTC